MLNTYSVSLNGTSQYATGASWKPTVFTISAWIKPTAVDASQVIFAGPSNDVELRINTDGKLRLSIWTGVAYENYDSTDALSAGVYQFVAGTYTAATKAWALYIGTGATANNSGTGTSALSWEVADSIISWGSRAVAVGLYFGGLIDDGRLWAAARTGAEISADASQELVGTETNLYGYYKFNNNLNDSDDAPHNLTGVDTPTFSTSVGFVWPKSNFFAIL